MPPKKTRKPRTFDEHLANVVESKRIKTRLTVEEFADATGIGYQTLRRRLNGAPFLVNEIERVAVVVEVTAARLVQEALDDFGGIDKLISQYRRAVASEPAARVTGHDNVTYIGYVDPPADAAADTNEHPPGKE